jgi:hypothetical protein
MECPENCTYGGVDNLGTPVDLHGICTNNMDIAIRCVDAYNLPILNYTTVEDLVRIHFDQAIFF